MKKGRVNATYEESYIEANRTFPKGKAFLCIIVLILQIAMIVGACAYHPTPQDIVREYDVTVQPQTDGSLDILYHFVWEAVDTSEALTWIEIGMANDTFTVYPDSLSSTIPFYSKDTYDNGIFLRLDLDRAYLGGEVLEFSFKVNQKNMLCQDASGYFYEFVPGWFNATPVESYCFRWAADGKIQSVTGTQRQDGYYTWRGSLECGEYWLMRIRYGQDSFPNCDTAPYRPFDDSGAYNKLADDRIALIVMACFGALILSLIQVWAIDSVVSYHRGRGFLTGHGFYVHAYGRSNPWYIKARDRYNAAHTSSHHGHSGGRSCACACACACAGGGRAGCSQKDTFETSIHKNTPI